MALLDSYINNGKVGVPNGRTPSAIDKVEKLPSGDNLSFNSKIIKIPDGQSFSATDKIVSIPDGDDNLASDKVVSIPNGGSLLASNKIVKLPDSSSYNPNSTDGIYNPSSKDILAKALGAHSARLFLKTYDFTRDPSKALFLANLAQQIVWGVLPKNKVPTHIHQDNIHGGVNDSYLNKLGKAITNKVRDAIRVGLDKATGGLVNNLLSLDRQPVTREYLVNQNLYGTGVGDPTKDRDNGDSAPIPFPLANTPIQSLGVPKNSKYRGDTLDDAKHKQVDIFEGTYGQTDMISSATQFNEIKNDDQYGLKKQFNEYNQNIIPYENLVTSYGIKASTQSPADAVKWAMDTLGCAIGYRNWYGFEPGSNHMWDIQIYPYNGPDVEPSDGGVFSENPEIDKTATPKLPSYKLPSMLGSNGADEEFSFGKHCPALSYSLQFGSQRSKDLPLFNGDSIHMPMGFNYEMIMSINILDDVFGNFSNWMNLYMNKIYNVADAAVVRYDEAAVIIRLLIFRDNYSPKYEFRFIAVPYNYSPAIEGDSAPNETQVHVEFHIIGMKSGIVGNVIQNEPKQNDNIMTKTSWTDVVISPHKQV